MHVIRGAARLKLLTIAACLAAAACANEPEPAKPAVAATAPASAPGRAVVSGTASPGAIITLESKTPRDFPAPAGAAVMDQFGMQFTPDLLVARVGQTVQFQSSEDVLHNVRVDEPETNTTVFNVATIAFGSYTHVFDKPGYYRVSCDVHPSMRANIFIATTPYTGIADGKGAFTIVDVEPGSYRARVLGTGAPSTHDLNVSAPRTELKLGEARPK